MCGIAGILAVPTPERMQLLGRLANVIAHRGPDNEGFWNDGKGVMLAHRRLSILDLSSAGNQPMHSACGRYHMIFNGEIYNFTELRTALMVAGVSFKGTSDSEVLLGVFSIWGIDAISRCDGMFAIAVWDSHDGCLHLIRDRMGEKPLFYATIGDAFYFGSELRCMREVPDLNAEVDRSALSHYVTFGYVPEPRSILKQVHKVPAAGIVTVRSGSHGVSTRTHSFWSLFEAARIGQASRFTDVTEALAAVEGEMASVIKRQMVSDVPLGAFLSGGIDSSLVVALMQAQSSRTINTYTIGFTESGFDERSQARAVAAHLGTHHVELPVTPGMALEMLPRIVKIYDEPLNDSSQIPTFLVCSLARRNVTVALTGDGADELFAGYHRHFSGITLNARIRSLPEWMRLGAQTMIRPMAWMASQTPGMGDWATRLTKARSLLNALTDEEGYRAMTAFHATTPGSGRNPYAHGLLIEEDSVVSPESSLPASLGVESLLFFDQSRYLPGDILMKVDRAAMSVGLETRAPFLDRGLVELSWRIPLEMKVRNGQGKWLLRQLLARHLPSSLIRKPKQGFSIPLSSWLRGALRPWAEALLDESRLRREGFFQPQAVRRMWDEHTSGSVRHRYTLWGILMFQAWLEDVRGLA
jgi:asparagine synthase (glutamine-hydrolysing)